MQQEARKPNWRRLLGLVVALSLMGFVGSRVPWRDKLITPAGDEVWSGTIVGDWKGTEVGFRFAADSELAPDSLYSGTALGALVVAGGELATFDKSHISIATERNEGPWLWRPGMPRAFAAMDRTGVVYAFGFMVLASLFAVTRWWRLLAIIDCRVKWTEALQLTYVGLFFNLVVPGLNGGDVVRGVMIVRKHPETRADALVSVFADRFMGLVAMVSLAVVVIFWNDDRLAELRLPVAGAFLALTLGSWAFVNPTIRRWVRFESLIKRLPQAKRIAKLDRATLKYAGRPWELLLAFGLSLGNHLSVSASVYSIGHAFGDGLALLDYICVVTVTNTLTSLPLSPGGWGVGEAAFSEFFRALGSIPTLGVATSVTYRLCMAALGLAGGVFLLAPGSGRVSETLEAVREEDAADD